ncbi:RecQ Superfamily II DNA helicase [Pyrenophora tritici-repentis]|nr:RecQ Superfamily II DNA helicase [Pyrenophora tritici-repentis]
MTICVSTATSLPSCCICLRNVYCRFNTIWHSSIIIRSSCRVARSRFKNVANSSPTADSGVTNTTAAASGGRRLCHSTHDIPSFLHRCAMSPRNAINGTTTTVVPPCSAHAGNMNNKLLPAPVGITATTGLSPAVMALIAAS